MNGYRRCGMYVQWDIQNNLDEPRIIILKQISYDITYMWNLKKMVRMNSFTKQTHRYRKQTYGYQRDVEG